MLGKATAENMQGESCSDCPDTRECETPRGKEVEVRASILCDVRRWPQDTQPGRA